MKNLLSVSLAILMLFACTTFVFAKDITLGENAEVGVAIEDVIATENDTRIQVPVTIAFSENSNGISGAEFIIKWDTTKLKLIVEEEEEEEEILKTPYFTFKKAQSNYNIINTSVEGQVRAVFGATTASNATSNGFFMLEFEPIDGAYGDASIWFDTEKEPVFTGIVEGKGTELAFTTIDGKVTLPKPKYTITYATTVGTAPETATGVEHGTKITLPTLSDEELTFKGWRVGETDEVVEGGKEYEVTSAVTLNAVWASTKIYLSSEVGNDENSGLKSDSAVKTLAKALELMTGDKDTLVIVDKYIVAKDNASGGATENLGVAGKTLTVMGKTQEAIFSLDRETNPETGEAWPYDDASVNLIGNVTFKNITVCGNDNDGKLQTNGFEFVYDNVGKGKYSLNVLVGKNNSAINLTSGAFNKIHMGVSGGTYTGNSSVTIDGGNVTAGYVNMAHGWHSNNIFNGKFSVTLNKGSVTNAISVDTEGQFSTNTYTGLRYITLNGGTVKDVVITSGPVYQVNGKEEWTEVQRSGVTVLEVNAPGIITGKIKAGRNKQLSTNSYVSDAYIDLSAKVIIFNNGSYDAGKIDSYITENSVAQIFNVKNGKLSAVTTEFDSENIGEWAKNVKLLGFGYTLPEEGDFNAVKVGNEIYFLEDLTDGLIAVPKENGTYDVEFGKAVTVTLVNGESEEKTPYFVGDKINFTRLAPQNNLKHAGWTETKDGATAEIAHTGEYEVTKDVTLYAVWSDVTSYTITFVTEHGTAPKAITKLDEDEDGKADEIIKLPDLGKVGHFTFKSWDLGTGNGNLKANAEYTLTKNITATAEWDEDPKATITYADEIFGMVPESYTGYVGDNFTTAAPYKVGANIPAGVTFCGWRKPDGYYYNAYDEDKIPEKGLTLTATWRVPFNFEVGGAKGEPEANDSMYGFCANIGTTLSGDTLPGSGTLKKVNCRFVGWATTEGGEVITEYTVKKENNVLYAVWEEVVENAGIIQTKVTYYSGSGRYVVDVYFSGYNANTVAFGYTYGTNLTFEKFTPASGLDFVANELTVNDAVNKYYATCLAKQEADGIIKGADGKVLLGTIEFVRDTSEGEYYQTQLKDNVQITTPKTTENNAYSEEYFLYVPYVASLEVEGKPIVFDEIFDYEIIDVEYTVNGSVKVVRADGTAPKNCAVIKVENGAGNVIKEVAIENAETTTENGVFEFSVNLPEGEYTAYIYKTGYARAKVEIKIQAQEGAEEEGFVPQPITIETVTLVAGDVVSQENVIDLLDFAAVTSKFEIGNIPEEIIKALDIDEDGGITVDDLYWIKKNFGYSEN